VIGLDERCDVYTENGPTGEMTVLSKADLACHFYHLNRQLVATATDRSELAAMRHLQFDYGYNLAEFDQCQLVDAAGTRWNPITGTFGANTWGMPFRWVDVKRADNG
jgi:hypothetical protein